MIKHRVDSEGNFEYTEEPLNNRTWLYKPDKDGDTELDSDYTDKPLWIPFDIIAAYVDYHRNKKGQ